MIFKQQLIFSGAKDVFSRVLRSLLFIAGGVVRADRRPASSNRLALQLPGNLTYGGEGRHTVLSVYNNKLS